MVWLVEVSTKKKKKKQINLLGGREGESKRSGTLLLSLQTLPRFETNLGILVKTGTASKSNSRARFSMAI